MPDYKDLLKNGWHPEKSGASIKGSVKSLVGRGDDKNKYEHHTPRPLSSLKDPASFAPPPKRTNTGSISLQEQQQAAGEEEEQERPKPPKPWSLNTTGLSTANLPPPPARRDVPSRPSSTSSTGGLGGPPPPPARSSPGVGQNPRAPPPALPPRLPPRSPAGGTNALDNLTKSISAASINNDPTVPKPNQGAMGRLAAAGVNVPGLGIGTASQPPPPPQPPRTSSPSSSSSPYTGLAKAGLNHYQSSTPEQKASLRNAAANSLTQQPQDSTTQSSSPYTSLAKAGLNRYNNSAPEQKAALQSAAKTGYNRYQSATPEQKAAVQNAASSAVRGGLERYNSAATAPEQKAGVSGAATSMFSAAIAAKKKSPPPPPPAKKPQFLVGRNNTGEDGDAPPPIPLGTRPF